jgi:hypothetical protein
MRPITGAEIHQTVEFFGFLALLFGAGALFTRNAERHVRGELAWAAWQVFMFIAALFVGALGFYYIVWGGILAYEWLGITPEGTMIVLVPLCLFGLIGDLWPDKTAAVFSKLHIRRAK